MSMFVQLASHFAGHDGGATGMNPSSLQPPSLAEPLPGLGLLGLCLVFAKNEQSE